MALYDSHAPNLQTLPEASLDIYRRNAHPSEIHGLIKQTSKKLDKKNGT